MRGYWGVAWESCQPGKTLQEDGSFSVAAYGGPLQVTDVQICPLQGLVAGLNAARAQELAPVIVPRNTSYIGTLIDDLVTKV